MEQEIVAKTPTKNIKLEKVAEGRVRFLTDGEELILKERMAPENFNLVRFAILTGLRQSEQFELKWSSNVDIENKLITIPKSKSGKTRHIQLNGEAVEILKSLPSYLYSERPHALVFPSQTPASPIDGQNFYKRVFIPALTGDETKKETKIEGVVWHTLRHTFASRLVMAGVDIRTVQDLMGHANINMTMKYSHLSKDHKQSAVERLTPKPVQAQPAGDEEGETAGTTRR